jgi:hypothetical protein
MKPQELYSSSILNDIDRITAPSRSLIDVSEKINKMFHNQAFEGYKDLTLGHDTFRNSFGMAETIAKITQNWVTPTDPSKWISIEPFMERWNEIIKPQLHGISLLSSPIISQLSAIDTAYKQVADLIQPMKPLSFDFSTVDFMSAAVVDMDLTDEDEAAVEDGLTIISEDFSTYASEVGKSLIHFEEMLSALQIKIDSKFKRHPLIIPLLMFVIAYYGTQLFDSFKSDSKSEHVKIERKVVTPRKKKIVYTKENLTAIENKKVSD